jgi:hypothetical protein
VVEPALDHTFAAAVLSGGVEAGALKAVVEREARAVSGDRRVTRLAVSPSNDRLGWSLLLGGRSVWPPDGSFSRVPHESLSGANGRQIVVRTGERSDLSTRSEVDALDERIVPPRNAGLPPVWRDGFRSTPPEG